ncbi:flotillin domain-containing protein [Paenibacillus rhizophilus]|uniref:flotillin domain-containing protein n=1 Tax=Paenibacillus rhizophilus TaxID=1850366 RepID=UPI001FE602C2|nr:flotillin domain-containing protein [Paenibacillus rhizophilus]
MAGAAEAGALEKKAEAYKQFTQAALTVEFLKVLPELAEKIASPLTKVDKITVISQDGASSGVNKITGDIAKIMAQIPELTHIVS